MGEWERLVQVIVEEVDECIKKRNNEALVLGISGKSSVRFPGRQRFRLSSLKRCLFFQSVLPALSVICYNVTN